MSLDDAETLKRFDRSGILRLMEQTPSRLIPPSDASTTYHNPVDEPKNVVLAGLGGSGIAGDIISDYCRTTTDTPVSVCRTLHIPRWVSKDTLFVAVSYSGETRETLSQIDQAAKRDARLAAITSGGELLSRAKARNIPYLQVPSQLPPRVALPELLAALMLTLSSANVVSNGTKLLKDASKAAKELIDQTGPSVPSSRNRAKRCAEGLVNALPLLIGDEEYGSVLRRFKNQINENAKMPAFYYSMPEGFHNDVEGLGTLAKSAKVQPIFLRTNDESEEQKRTYDHLASSMRDVGFPPSLEFEAVGPDRFSRLITAVTFADFVSVYMAVLRQVDPAQLTLIPRFRSIMRGE